MINKFTKKDIMDIMDIVQTKDQINSLLFELSPSDAVFMYDHMNNGYLLPDAKAYQNMIRLEESSTIDYISTEKDFRIHKNRYSIFRSIESPDKYKLQVFGFANRIFRKIYQKPAEVITNGIRFDPSYVFEIFACDFDRNHSL